MAEGNSVQVAVRVRPISEREKDFDCVVSMSGKSTVIKSPKDGGDRTFSFDHSFWSCRPEDRHFASQEHVFKCLGEGVLVNAFAGYNACILAYGQTGSGKTYTMMGREDNRGLIPRLCDAIFARIAANTDKNASYKVEASYMEIYNEKVQDLLATGHKAANLRVREHSIYGPYVEGLSKLAVTNFDTISMLMTAGNKARHTAATLMNDQSSRSHAVFTVVLTQAHFDPATKSTGEKVSRICLVDLAGSERHSKTGTVGDRLKEGANINKSLTTLGLVINALADISVGKNSKKFVPYRDSTLTWLLKDNLGGNARTVMVATVSPVSDNYEESLSTLRYADQAKRIVNHAVINEDPNARLIRELREELERLRAGVGSGPGGAMDSAELEAMRLRLAETENLMQEMSLTWEEKLRATERIVAEHQRLLDEHGASVRGDGERALRVESRLPHFLAINDDMLSSEITIYTFREGITTFGAAGADPAPDIVLTGSGVAGEMCAVEHKIDMDSEENCLMEVVTLFPIGDCCYVEGVQVTEDTRLRHGQTVQLGSTNFYRFNHPTEAHRLRQRLGDGRPLPRQPSGSSFAVMGAQLREQLETQKSAMEAERLRFEQERQARDEELARREDEARRRMEEAQRTLDERSAAEAEERLRKEEENRQLKQRLLELEAMFSKQQAAVKKEEGAAKTAAAVDRKGMSKEQQDAERKRLKELLERERMAEDKMRQLAEERERAAQELYEREIQMQLEADRRLQEAEEMLAQQMAEMKRVAEESQRKAEEERQRREQLERQTVEERQKLEERRLEEQLQREETERRIKELEQEIQTRSHRPDAVLEEAQKEMARQMEELRQREAAAKEAERQRQEEARRAERAREEQAREEERVQAEEAKRQDMLRQLEAREAALKQAIEDKKRRSQSSATSSPASSSASTSPSKSNEPVAAVVVDEPHVPGERNPSRNAQAKEMWLAEMRKKKQASVETKKVVEDLQAAKREEEDRTAEVQSRRESVSAAKAARDAAAAEAERLRQGRPTEAVDSEIRKQWGLFEDKAKRKGPTSAVTSGSSSAAASSGPSPVGSSVALAELNPLPPRHEPAPAAPRPMMAGSSSSNPMGGSAAVAVSPPPPAAAVPAKSKSAPPTKSFNPFDDFKVPPVVKEEEHRKGGATPFDEFNPFPRHNTVGAIDTTAKKPAQPPSASSMPARSATQSSPTSAPPRLGLPTKVSQDTFSNLMSHPFGGPPSGAGAGGPAANPGSSSGASASPFPDAPPRSQSASRAIKLPAGSAFQDPTPLGPAAPTKEESMRRAEKKIIEAQVSWAINRGSPGSSGPVPPENPALAEKVEMMIKAQLAWDDKRPTRS